MSGKAENQADLYTYRVFWSPEDEEFVAVSVEFGPGLSWLDASPDKAFAGIRRLVARTVREMASAGEPVPEPLSTRAFSGKFVVRVPPELHRQLATEAREAGISMNRFVAHRLEQSKRQLVELAEKVPEALARTAMPSASRRVGAAKASPGVPSSRKRAAKKRTRG